MTVSRLVFTIILITSFLAALPAGHAQQPGKLFRIGFLGSGGPADHAPRVDAFRQGLRDLGYVEGRTASIEYRLAEGKMERLPALAVPECRERGGRHQHPPAGGEGGVIGREAHAQRSRMRGQCLLHRW